MNTLGLTTKEWQVKLGESIRDARIARQYDQNFLANLADISVRSLRNMENGDGSSLNSLIKVVRALDRVDWLEAFDEGHGEPGPLELLHPSKLQPKKPQRVSANRSTAKRDTANKVTAARVATPLQTSFQHGKSGDIIGRHRVHDEVEANVQDLVHDDQDVPRP